MGRETCLVGGLCPWVGRGISVWGFQLKGLCLGVSFFVGLCPWGLFQVGLCHTTETYTPSPCEQNDRHLRKHCLPTTLLAGGNKIKFTFKHLLWCLSIIAQSLHRQSMWFIIFKEGDKILLIDLFLRWWYIITWPILCLVVDSNFFNFSNIFFLLLNIKMSLVYHK